MLGADRDQGCPELPGGRISGVSAASAGICAGHTPCRRTVMHRLLAAVHSCTCWDALPTRLFCLSTASLWTWGSPRFQQGRSAGSSLLWCFIIWAPSCQHLGCIQAISAPLKNQGLEIVHAQSWLVQAREGFTAKQPCTSDHSPLCGLRSRPWLLTATCSRPFRAREGLEQSSAFRCSHTVRKIWV